MPSTNALHPLEQLLKRYWQINEFKLIGRYDYTPGKKFAFFNDLRTSTGDLLYFPDHETTGLKSKLASASLLANDKLNVGEYYQFIAILNANENELGRNPLFVLPQPFGKVSHQIQLRLQKEQLVKDIFRRNGASPHDAQNIANSLKNFQIELYTKTERFIFELLQNADDFPTEGKEVDIIFEVLQDNVLVQHNGRPFSPRDVESICSIGSSSKSKDISATGYKGIGFKSVFTHANRVFISSGGYSFCFNKEHPTYLDFDKMFPLLRNNFLDDKSKYIGAENIPWQIKPIWREKHLFAKEVRSRDDFFKQNVSFCLEFGYENSRQFLRTSTIFFKKDARFLLFLRNIKKVTLLSGVFSYTIERVIGKNDVTINVGGDPKKYLVYKSKNIDFTNEKQNFEKEVDIPQKLKDFPFLTLSFAALIEANDIQIEQAATLFTYLPTEDTRYNFPFLVNGDFVTTSNREQILPGNKWNALVFGQIGFQLFCWIRHIISTGDYVQNAYNLIPQKLEGNTNVEKDFNKGFDKALAEVEFIRNIHGDFQLLADTLIDKTGISSVLGVDFTDIFGIDKVPIDCSLSIHRIHSLIENSELGQIFDFDDLKALCSEDTMKFWLSQPRNNLSFILHLSKKKWLERFSESPIYLDQNGQLRKQNELYDSFSTDLVLLEWLSLSFLNPIVSDGMDGVTFPVKIYTPKVFIKEYILGNKSEVDDLLDVKENNINFYRYIFKHQKSLPDDEFFGPEKLNYFKVWGISDYISDFDENIYIYNSNIEGLLKKQAIPNNQLYVLSAEFCESKKDDIEWTSFWKRFGVSGFDGSTAATFLEEQIIHKTKDLVKYFSKFDFFNEDEQPTDSFLIKRDANIALWEFIGETLKLLPDQERKKLEKELSNVPVFSTDDTDISPLKECYLSEAYTQDPTLERLANEFEDIQSHFVSGVYAERANGLSLAEWRNLFKDCGAQTTTENFAERLANQLDDIEDNNLLSTTKFLFRNRKIFNDNYENLQNLRIIVSDGMFLPEDTVLGSHYTGNSIIDIVLPGIQLANLVSDLYSKTQLTEWRSFFEKAGVVILNTEQEVIEYKIKYWLEKQDELNTPEINISIVNELISLFKENKLEGLFEELGGLKLLLKGNGEVQYLKADECHLSTEYKPKLDLELILEEDESLEIFVSPLYINKNRENARSFLEKIGASSDLEAIERGPVRRSSLNWQYRAAIDSAYSGVKLDAKSNGSNHRVLSWVELNYDDLLNNPKVNKRFWEKILKSKSFQERVFKPISYNTGRHAYQHCNYLLFRLQTEPLVSTIGGTLSKPSRLYSYSLKDIVDDLDLLPLVDLREIFYNNTTLEKWLGINQNLSLGQCIRRIGKIQDIDRLENDNIWRRIVEIFTREKKEISTADREEFDNFCKNGYFPNQLGIWKPISELFYVSDGFNLGVGNSEWLILDNLKGLAAEFRLKGLTEKDFQPEYRNAKKDNEFLTKFQTRVKYIAFAESPTNSKQIETQYLDTRAPLKTDQ